MHFQIAREGRRLSVLKRSFEVKLGILLRIRSYENIAGGFLFACSFQSPKNPIFSIFVDTLKLWKLCGQNSFPGTSKFTMKVTVRQSSILVLQHIKNSAWVI